jgi:hypothetical protein
MDMDSCEKHALLVNRYRPCYGMSQKFLRVEHAKPGL